jgi:hypothetical protein
MLKLVTSTIAFISVFTVLGVSGEKRAILPRGAEQSFRSGFPGTQRRQ